MRINVKSVGEETKDSTVLGVHQQSEFVFSLVIVELMKSLQNEAS